MASPVESNGPGKDPKSSSAVDESQLEKSIIRRGLATAAEIEACKSQRKQLVAKENDASQEPAGNHGRGQGLDPQPGDAPGAGSPARPIASFRSLATRCSRSSARARWGLSTRPSK